MLCGLLGVYPLKYAYRIFGCAGSAYIFSSLYRTLSNNNLMELPYGSLENSPALVILYV